MKVTEPTIECQRSELRRQKWCILLTMSKYLNSPERPCDNDNLVHPNDRRGPESPTVGAKRSKEAGTGNDDFGGGDNEDLGNNGDDNCCSSLEEGRRGAGGAILDS